jgi:hypothetical protein
MDPRTIPDRLDVGMCKGGEIGALDSFHRSFGSFFVGWAGSSQGSGCIRVFFIIVIVIFFFIIVLSDVFSIGAAEFLFSRSSIVLGWEHWRSSLLTCCDDGEFQCCCCLGFQ